VWLPRSAHCSQLEHATGYQGNGLLDCGPCSCVRYLREAGKLPIDGDIPAQLSDAAYAIRGHPDDWTNGTVSVAALQTYLGSYGIASHYTEDYAVALQSPWSILLVDAFNLAPAQYPQDASWLGWDSGQGDHFIAWLPVWQGSTYWVDDPLAFNNGEQDCIYDAGALASAFRAALILPSTHHGEDPVPVPHPPAPAPVPVRRMASRQVGLKLRSAHGGKDIYTIPAHGQLIDLGVRNQGWAWVLFRDRRGWIPADAIVDLGGV